MDLIILFVKSNPICALPCISDPKSTFDAVPLDSVANSIFFFFSWSNINTYFKGKKSVKILLFFSDQILGAYGPKLKELELTGNRLRGVTLDAFEGIDSYELLLAIRDSSLETLPMHFYTMFENVAHWSLDLSNNKLSSLEANTLYQNGTDWKLKGTSMLQGKMKIQCCQLLLRNIAS